MSIQLGKWSKCCIAWHCLELVHLKVTSCAELLALLTMSNLTVSHEEPVDSIRGTSPGLNQL